MTLLSGVAAIASHLRNHVEVAVLDNGLANQNPRMAITLKGEARGVYSANLSISDAPKRYTFVALGLVDTSDNPALITGNLDRSSEADFAATSSASSN